VRFLSGFAFPSSIRCFPAFHTGREKQGRSMMPPSRMGKDKSAWKTRSGISCMFGAAGEKGPLCFAGLLGYQNKDARAAFAAGA
jgi:hypothetical protein